jgi:hypothetical protein
MREFPIRPPLAWPQHSPADPTVTSLFYVIDQLPDPTNPKTPSRHDTFLVLDANAAGKVAPIRFRRIGIDPHAYFPRQALRAARWALTDVPFTINWNP